MHYLDHACFSPPAAETIRAVQAASDSLTRVGGAGATELALDWMGERARARESVARLLDASPVDVSLVENTTQGLGIVAGGLRLNAGDNVVVADCDFVGIPTVWRAHQRAGVHLRAAPSDGGQVRLDALRQTVDDRTRVICISAIQEVSGWPIDLDGAAEVAETVKAHLVVDGAQEAGVVCRVPSEHGLAAYSAGGHKWLRNPYGLGFLWTSAALREQLQPPYQGYFALHEPPGGWQHHLTDPGTFAHDRLDLSNDGQSLETGGTPNWLGAIGLATATDALHHAGRCRVEQRALHLADTLRAGLQRLEIPSLTPIGCRSPIVTFTTHPHGHDPQVVAVARREHVEVSIRGGAGVRGIRAACHAHNTEDDVNALLDVVTTMTRGARTITEAPRND